MIEQLNTDLGQLMTLFVIFGCAYGANVLLSLRLNICYFKKKFQPKMLIDSVIQVASIIGGTALLVVTIDGLLYATELNQTKLGEFVTVASVLLTIGLAVVKYSKEAYEKLTQILNISKGE